MISLKYAPIVLQNWSPHFAHQLANERPGKWADYCPPWRACSTTEISKYAKKFFPTCNVAFITCGRFSLSLRNRISATGCIEKREFLTAFALP